MKTTAPHNKGASKTSGISPARKPPSPEVSTGKRDTRLKNLTLRQLRLFEAVASNLSYSRAAEQMSLTQPAVSMQVQQLEADLGLQLLIKTGKRVSLSQAGEEMLRQARRILN